MRLLVVSPHTDDETLGAGGAILRLKEEGNKVCWLNFTDIQKNSEYTQSRIRNRASEIEKVRKLYRFDEFYNLKLEPTGLDKYPKNKLIEKSASIIKKIMPDTVVLPFRNDAHSDHRIVFEIIYSCTKVFRSPFIKKILMMEILSETDFASSDNGFVPNYFMDITGYLEKKIKIMETYKDELGEHPFARSAENIRALAVYRGAGAGCLHAEGFILLKAIE